MSNNSTIGSAEDDVEVTPADASSGDLKALLRAETVNLSAHAGLDPDSLSDEETAEAALALFRTILTEQDDDDWVRELSVEDVDGPTLELRHLAPGETEQARWNHTMELICRCSGVYRGGDNLPVPKTIYGVIVDTDGEELATWELHRAFVEKLLFGDWSLEQFGQVMTKTRERIAPSPSDANSSD